MRINISRTIVVAALVAPLVAAQPASSLPAITDGSSSGQAVTDFWYRHSAFGTRVNGNPLVSSGKTAYSYLPCTNRTGVSHENRVAEAEVPGFVSAKAIKSSGWTSEDGGTYATDSVNTVAGGSLGEGRVEFRGIEVHSKAYNDGSYGAESTSEILGLTIDGEEVPLDDGSYRKFQIPGLGTLHVNQTFETTDATSADARAIALRLVSAIDKSRVRVGYSHARITSEEASGPFAGPAYASNVKALDGTALSGPTALQPMPCKGTDGEVLENDTVSGPDGTDMLQAEGVATKVSADKAEMAGWTEARIAKADLGDGQLVVDAIVARASADRNGSEVVKSADGTTFGSLTVGGETYTPDMFDPGEPVEIPGIAVITYRKIEETANSIKATTLEVVMFPDTPLESTVELGVARMAVRKS